MRLDKLLIGLGMFLLFVTAGTFIMFSPDADGRSFYSYYNISVDETDFNTLPDEINRVYNVSSEQKGDITEQDIEVTTGWESMLTGGYTALKTFLGSFTIAGEIIMAIGKILPIPDYFLSFAAICFMIIVTFTILYMLFRFMPRE